MKRARRALVIGGTGPTGADPHFRESLEAELAGRVFDLTVATYGRLRHIAAALVELLDQNLERLQSVDFGEPPSFPAYAIHGTWGWPSTTGAADPPEPTGSLSLRALLVTVLSDSVSVWVA